MLAAVPRQLRAAATRRVAVAAARNVPKVSSGVVAAAFGGAVAFALTGEKKTVSAEVDVAALEKRVAELEVAAGGATHSAFVFIKPHAVYDKVKDLVKDKLGANAISVVSEGAIPAERIDKEQLIDTHYGAIAAKAVKLKPKDLTVQPKAQAEFQSTFGKSWDDAINGGLVFNAMDACQKLSISTEELGAKFTKGKKLKFGGGFYCGEVDGIYVINGFYMNMRSAFTRPGECIYYYEVQWDPKALSWAKFRSEVLGGTNPKDAHGESVRHLIYAEWEQLGLKSCPNTGDNGVHASASPFEAMAERNNWLGASLMRDYFGKAMMAVGVPPAMLKAWCDDPPVNFEGKKQSIFDLVEDLDGTDLLKKAAKIAKEN